MEVGRLGTGETGSGGHRRLRALVSGSIYGSSSDAVTLLAVGGLARALIRMVAWCGLLRSTGQAVIFSNSVGVDLEVAMPRGEEFAHKHAF